MIGDVGKAASPSPRSTAEDLQYLRKHDIENVLGNLLCQLLKAKPEDPVKHLLEVLASGKQGLWLQRRLYSVMCKSRACSEARQVHVQLITRGIWEGERHVERALYMRSVGPACIFVLHCTRGGTLVRRAGIFCDPCPTGGLLPLICWATLYGFAPWPPGHQQMF